MANMSSSKLVLVSVCTWRHLRHLDRQGKKDTHTSQDPNILWVTITSIVSAPCIDQDTCGSGTAVSSLSFLNGTLADAVWN